MNEIVIGDTMWHLTPHNVNTIIVLIIIIEADNEHYAFTYLIKFVLLRLL